MKVAETFRTTISYHHALVAQLDSVSASDAEGCGFDPRRVHQSPLFRGLLHSAGEQPLVRPTPKAAHEPLAAKYPRRVHQSPLLRGLLHTGRGAALGSPDAEGGARAACGEVSPPGAPKPPLRGLLHSAGVRTHRSPDAEGGARAACGEVSPPGAPKQTEIEPYISIRKRCSGSYLCKVRKKHKVKCLVLFLLPTPKETLFMEQKS